MVSSKRLLKVAVRLRPSRTLWQFIKVIHWTIAVAGKLRSSAVWSASFLLSRAVVTRQYNSSGTAFARVAKEQREEDRERYAFAEFEARAKHVGLWQDKNPIPPLGMEASEAVINPLDRFR